MGTLRGGATEVARRCGDVHAHTGVVPGDSMQGDSMSDAMSFAEVQDQLVELLPNRTVLSLLPVAQDVIGTPGKPGTPGNSASLVDSAWAGLVGSNGPSGATGGITQPSGITS